MNPSNGYRSYSSAQIADAQVIRQLRALDVPIDSIRRILDSDIASRHELISEHFRQLEDRLEVTRAAVTSLRGLLEPSPEHPAITRRSVPATPVLILRETIDASDLSEWYVAATAELTTLVTHPAGPRGGLWSTDLFLHERGRVALFVAVSDGNAGDGTRGRLRRETLPAIDVAVLTHRGPDETIAQSYGALGAYIADHEIGLEGPLREAHLDDSADNPVTEIGWPIFRTAR